MPGGPSGTSLVSIPSRTTNRGQFGTRTPWTGQGPWTLDARAGWFDATQVGYYGTGMDQTLPRANFRLQQAYAALTGTLRPSGWSRLRGEFGYEGYDTEEGQGGEPSIETIYTPDTASGLFATPTFVRTEAMAAIDWRPSPGYARKGGLYGVTLAELRRSRRHVQLSAVSTASSFSTCRSCARPGSSRCAHGCRRYWTTATRCRISCCRSLAAAGRCAATQTGRFRDRHSLLTTAEFRWIPNRLALDMALFYDAGKVTNRRARSRLRRARQQLG